MMFMTTPLAFHLPKLPRFIRFLTVGVVGTLLDFTLLTLLKRAGLPTLPANTLSFTAGLINNFTWNRLWTFRENAADWRKQLVQFTFISLIGLALNNLIVLALEALLGTFLGPLAWVPAKLLATALVVFWNYFANRKWTFSQTSEVSKQLPVNLKRC